MGKISERIEKTFEDYKNTNDFDSFVKTLIDIGDSCVWYAWQRHLVDVEIKKQLKLMKKVK